MKQLISMKRTKRSKAESDKMSEPVAIEEDDYPYGLEIRLEKAELTKLGIDIDDFSIGGAVAIACKAEITQLSEPANKNSSHTSASFQITAMAIKTHPNPKPKKLRDILSLVNAKIEMEAGA